MSSLHTFPDEIPSIHSLSKDQAIEYIMDQYGEELKRLIYSYVKNHSQTDDLFQDIMMKIYEQLHTFEERASLRTWLYRITANKCKDYLRSPFHRLFIWKEKFLERADNKTPEKTVLLDEKKREVIRAIMELPIKDREVLILRYYQGFSIQEISDLLQVNPSTIKSRIMRAKGKLKKELREEFLYE